MKTFDPALKFDSFYKLLLSLSITFIMFASCHDLSSTLRTIIDLKSYFDLKYFAVTSVFLNFDFNVIILDTYQIITLLDYYKNIVNSKLLIFDR